MYCHECDFNICTHKVYRAYCLVCNSHLVCEHGLFQTKCVEGACGLIPSAAKCSVCCSKRACRTTKGDPDATRMCSGCRNDKYKIKARTKQEEEKVKAFLKTNQIWGNWSYYDVTLPCAKTKRRVDFLYVLMLYAILLEVDERMHMQYTLACEITRLNEISEYVKKPLHVIRYNPHRSNFGELAEALTAAFKKNYAIQNDWGCCIQYLGYTDSRIYALELAEIELQQAAFALM